MRGRLSEGHERRTSVILAVGVLLGAVAGCNDPPVSPLPIQTSVTVAAPSPTAGPLDSPAPTATTAALGPPVVTATPRSRRPTRTTRATPTTTPPTSPPVSLPPACLGAVRYELDAAAPESVELRSLCLGTGATLRIVNAGPADVTAKPADLVSREYEAGVTDLTMLGPGTVQVTITRQSEPHVITVVVQPLASASASATG